MKLTARRKQSIHRTPLRLPLLPILDEFAYYAQPMAASLFAGSRSLASAAKPARSLIHVTQFIIEKNSGQRLRMVALSRWAETGEPLRKRPTKFLPAQVRRRMAPRDWDEYETELAVRTLTRPIKNAEAA